MEASLFELEAKKLNGETISLKEFEGKTIVVVNTASKCGLTPQYEGLKICIKYTKTRGWLFWDFLATNSESRNKAQPMRLVNFAKLITG